MARLPHNIEGSGFRRGEYVGYAPIGTLRIRRGGRGWETYANASNPHPCAPFSYATAPTLIELSAKLERMN